jgi:hypothetical protein
MTWWGEFRGSGISRQVKITRGVNFRRHVILSAAKDQPTFTRLMLLVGDGRLLWACSASYDFGAFAPNRHRADAGLP